MQKKYPVPSIVPQVVFDKSFISLVDKYRDLETPFMLIDLEVIKENCRKFKAALPDVGLYYAVKALYAREIITFITDDVDGFDVASLKEIEDLLEYGINPERLNFSNPVKSGDSIKKAYQLGVKKFAFQSLSELAKLQMYAPGASVYVRVRLKDLSSFVPLSEKFGCNPEEAVELLLYAQRVGLRPVGLTFHVGSQLLDNEAWEGAIRSASRIVHRARRHGVRATQINIGGGFPAQYFKGDPDIEAAADYINRSLEVGDVSYVAEPGRYVVANSSVIVSKIIGVERRNGKNWLFVDTGFFQSFLGTLHYDVFPYQPISLSHHRLGRSKASKDIPYVLTGPTCDSQDIIATDVYLPSDLALDDLLVFPNTGAYTLVYGSNFNGFPVPKKYYVKDGELL